MKIHAPAVTGSITITPNLTVTGSTLLGTTLSTTHTMTGSFAVTGSISLNGQQIITTGDYTSFSGSVSTRVTNLESTASVLTAASASFSLVSASYASFSGSYRTGSFTGSFVGSLQGTSSWAVNAVTASTADNFVVRQSLTGSNALFTGAITAQTLVVQTVTSSIVYSSGSNTFGDELTDVQQMTGSVRITGSLSVNGTSVPTGTGTQNYVTKWNNAAGTTIGDSSIQDNTLNVLVSKNSAVNDIGMSILQSANGTAAYLQLAGTNDAGSRYNFIHSLTNGGSEHWRIGGAGSPENVSFYTGGTEKMRITGSNVGIGTATPSSALHILKYDSTSNPLSFSNTSALILQNTYGLLGDSGFAIFFKSDTGTYNTFAGIAGNMVGSTALGSYGDLIFGTKATDAATSLTERMRIKSNGDIKITAGSLLGWSDYSANVSGVGVTAVTSPSETLLFYSAGAERMRITNGGNVGIGTTSPTQKLQVEGTGTTYALIKGGGNNTTGLLTQNGNKQYFTGTYYNVSDAWEVADLTAGGLTRLVITSGGNVGIGTDTPAYKLDVSTTSGENYIRVNSATNQDGGYRISENGTNKWLLYNVAASDAFEIYDNTAVASRMRITSGGNVLINTTTDAGYKLDVNGTGRFSSSVTAGTDVTLNNGTLFVSAGSGNAYSSRLSTVYNYPYIETYLDSYAGTSYEGRLLFRTNSGGGAMSTKLTIANSGAATFSSSVTAGDTITGTGNATASAAFIANNPSGNSGTAQYYTDFKAGSTLIARLLRGNGASGLEANGLNIDNYAGFKVRLNELGGSGGSFTIDGGNLGLGVTPSAWGSSFKAIDINSYGSLVASTAAVNILANSYYNGTDYIYKANGLATMVAQTGGYHQWFIAPSGTAGNAITFTQAMTLDANGRLGIGTTSPSGRIHVTSLGITPSQPQYGWPVYNAELDPSSSRAIYVDTGGNGPSNTAGNGATVSLILGQYYDSRAVITTIGAGGDSPSDQGTGYGKDLMIKAGTSDNGAGKKGGKLYLNGGMGYQSAYNTNVGDIVMQGMGGGGYVGIGTKNPSATLTVSGSHNILILTSSNYNQSFEITFNSNANSFFEAFNEQGENAWYNYTYSGSYRYDFIGYDGMFFRYGHPYGQSNIMEPFSTRSNPFLLSYWPGGSNEANATLDMEIRDHRWVGVNGNSFAKFTSSGSFAISDSGTYYEMQSKVVNSPIIRLRHSGTTQPIGMWVEFSAASPDNNTEYFFRGSDSTTDRIYIYSDGDLANHDGVYGSISDIKLKQDIVDATAQWDDIKNIRFRKYRLKKDVEINPNAPYLLGVVAQELELTSPGLVESHPDFKQVEVPALSENGEQLKDSEGNLLTKLIDEPTGTYTKTVKSSILLMKAAKALQEAIERIEVLEAEIQLLKSKLS